MNELKLEDLERLIGKIIIANHMNEQNMIAQIEYLQQENENLKKAMKPNE